MNNKGISIIICCYNSAARIEETLQHIFSLTVPPDCSCEVLLVNNLSTDNTKEVVMNTYNNSGIKQFALRIIDESQPGLAFARAKGVQESRFETIIFCDDDNHLSSDYLIVAKRILDEHNDVGLVGGWAKPNFSIVNKAWLEDFYPAMAIGPQAATDGVVSWIYGAGMIARKKVFNELAEKGIQTQLTDRIGAKLTSGGDAEICLLTNFIGYKIYYSSQLSLSHAIPANRLKKKHYLNAKFNTVYPSIYIYLLQALTSKNQRRVGALFTDFCVQKMKNIFYYMPRIVIGKHRFFSFFSLYRNFQILIWAIIYRNKFYCTYLKVRKNLSLEGNTHA